MLIKVVLTHLPYDSFLSEPRVQEEGTRGRPPALECIGQHLPVFRGPDPVLGAQTPEGADLLPRRWGPTHILTDLVQG